jgi:hypothetical protein
LRTAACTSRWIGLTCARLKANTVYLASTRTACAGFRVACGQESCAARFKR